MELRAVAIDAVTHIPLHMLAHGVIDPHAVPFFAHHGQRGLHHGAEQQPVVVARSNRPRRQQGGGQVALRAVVEFRPQFAGGAQEGLRQETAIDNRLVAIGIVQEIGRSGVSRGTDGVAGEAGASLLPVAFRTAGERGFEPRRHARQESRDGLQVGELAPGGFRAGGALHGHIALQRAGGQIDQHGLRQPGEQPDPVIAAGCRGLRRGAGYLRGGAHSGHRL